MLCVRLPRVAVAEEVGHRGDEPAVDWTLPCRLLAAGGVDARLRSIAPPFYSFKGGKKLQSLPTLAPSIVSSPSSPKSTDSPARKQGHRARFRPASPIHPPQVRPLAPISGKNAFLWRNISAFARKFRAFLLTWCCSRGVCRWEARRLESADFYCSRNFRSELVRVHADRFDGDGRRLCWDQECLGAWEVRATGWH